MTNNPLYEQRNLTDQHPCGKRMTECVTKSANERKTEEEKLKLIIILHLIRHKLPILSIERYQRFELTPKIETE